MCQLRQVAWTLGCLRPRTPLYTGNLHAKREEKSVVSNICLSPSYRPAFSTVIFFHVSRVYGALVFDVSAGSLGSLTLPAQEYKCCRIAMTSTSPRPLSQSHLEHHAPLISSLRSACSHCLSRRCAGPNSAIAAGGVLHRRTEHPGNRTIRSRSGCQKLRCSNNQGP